MRENRTYGSEGGEPSNGSLPYPYRAALASGLCGDGDVATPLSVHFSSSEHG